MFLLLTKDLKRRKSNKKPSDRIGHWATYFMKRILHLLSNDHLVERRFTINRHGGGVITTGKILGVEYNKIKKALQKGEYKIKVLSQLIGVSEPTLRKLLKDHPNLLKMRKRTDLT